MKWLFALLALTLCIPAFAQPITAPDDAAKAWLLLVDDGQYAKSWDEAGAAFKNRLNSEAWQQKIAPVRAPLGAVASRNIKSVALSRTMPGMPDGQYAVVRFDTVFAHKAAAVETVSLGMEKGQWTVIGYLIN